MKPRKILVITNDDTVFAKLYFEFDANQYTLQRLVNPLLSVEVLNNEDFYAIVSDLSIKEIFMIDMLNNIFIHTNIPVVLLSSNITAEDILLAYEFGFLEILHKDYKKGEIKKLIEYAVID